jgi:hypothetical protein
MGKHYTHTYVHEQAVVGLPFQLVKKEGEKEKDKRKQTPANGLE